MSSSDFFSSLSGSGVHIGIIDSGYSRYQEKTGDIRKGIDIKSGLREFALSDVHYANDTIGHGTACTGIILKKSPAAVIYPVKVFDQDLVCNVDELISAIEWCIKNDMHVINLSLGTTDENAKDKLNEVCQKARKAGIYLVAAIDNSGNKSYPAVLPYVFGVTAAKVTGKYSYYFSEKEEIQFMARGDRQRLDWLDETSIVSGGTSFAAPHITSLVALILEKYPNIHYQEMCKILSQYSLCEKPSRIPLGKGSVLGARLSHTKVGIRLEDIYKKKNLNWINRAVVFPFNKEMHSLVRFKEMLQFDLQGVVDLVGKRTIGKDSGVLLGQVENGIVIEKNLKEALQDADSLVLGYLDKISEIKRRDVMQEVLETALELKKNVYSLSPLVEEKYKDLLKSFKEHGMKIEAPTVEINDFINITNAFDWRDKSTKPVLGVLGTSSHQGKFTAQLALKQGLIKAGYKVGHLSTEHQGLLLGADFVFPNGYDGHKSIQIPMDLHVHLLHSAMVGVERGDPDIVVVGGQSAVVPYNFAEKSTAYTLQSLTVILGTQPDAFILVVNSIDEFHYINETLNVLKGLSKADPVLLVFSNKAKEVISRTGRIAERFLDEDEIEAVRMRLENQFKIPATEVVSDKGKEILVKTVVNYFS